MARERLRDPDRRPGNPEKLTYPLNVLTSILFSSIRNITADLHPDHVSRSRLESCSWLLEGYAERAVKPFV
jgi:hypothetical protein